MEKVIQRMGVFLEIYENHYSVEQHVRLYAIAARFELHNLGKCAAKRILSLPLDKVPKTPEFRHISGTAVYNLYQYHFACGRLAHSVLIETFESSWWRDVSGLTNLINCACGSGTVPGTGSLSFKDWFLVYVNQLSLDLSLVPVGSTVEDASLVDKAVSMMLNCESCKEKFGAFEKFRNWLCERIDAAVSQVSMNCFSVAM